MTVDIIDIKRNRSNESDCWSDQRSHRKWTEHKYVFEIFEKVETSKYEHYDYFEQFLVEIEFAWLVLDLPKS